MAAAAANALGRRVAGAARRDLAQVLARVPEVKEVLLDGTERPIARPEHKGRRDRHYSGRRRRTTVKNVVATAGGLVVLRTPTVAGRRHDKTEADRARLRLDDSLRLLGDSGFQGYEAGAARVCTPRRKPPERALHWRHRRANRRLARARVPVEHALASVKRLGILRQPLRAKRPTTADLAMLIGCGLHNYRSGLGAGTKTETPETSDGIVVNPFTAYYRSPLVNQ